MVSLWVMQASLGEKVALTPILRMITYLDINDALVMRLIACPNLHASQILVLFVSLCIQALPVQWPIGHLYVHAVLIQRLIIYLSSS